MLESRGILIDEREFSVRHLLLKAILVPMDDHTMSTHFLPLVLFPRHFKDQATRDKTIDCIHTFRDYLHYHIKCSKVSALGQIALCYDSQLIVLLISGHL